MKLSIRMFALILLIVLSFSAIASADTLRVATWNSLNFRGEEDEERLDYFRTVISYLQPDVVVMQEIHYEEAVDYLLSFAYLPVFGDFASAVFHDGYGTDNALFYRTTKVGLVSQRFIPTDLRDIAEYKLLPIGQDSSDVLRFYSAHLKASDGADNEERRRIEAAALRQQLNLLTDSSYFILGGDLNLYGADEPAYELMLDAEPDPDGQLFDPIDRYGNWHNSASFADIHTQSPRIDGDGGAGGGMDDRFDFLLASSALMEQNGYYIIPETYQAFGNDGLHFNRAINDGINTAVPDSVADALLYASDHLPVTMCLYIPPATPVTDAFPVLPENYRLLNCYPNPFNSMLTVELNGVRTAATLTVVDLLGREMFRKEVSPHSNTYRLQFNMSPYADGLYFIVLRSQTDRQIQKVMQIR